VLGPLVVLYRRTFLVSGLSGAATLVGLVAPALAKNKGAPPKEEKAADTSKSKIRDVDQDTIGTTFELGLDHAPYPDGSGRYSDDTVMVFVPEHYRLPSDKKIDFVVHFHGHNSSAKDVISNHKLRDQVRESRQNAVLVVPQGPVAAADGDFGKLMKKDGLADLLDEVREVIATKKASNKLGDASVRGAKATGRVVLTSHSGGYHAVAVNLKSGGVTVREVYLFDSLYDDVPAFRDWVVESPKHHKLVSYYIGGRTLEASVELAHDLEDEGIDVVREENGELATRGELTKGRAVFLVGKTNHYAACYDEHPLRECLRASCLKGMGSGNWLSKKSAPRET
jgi:hypothetical protein